MIKYLTEEQQEYLIGLGLASLLSEKMNKPKSKKVAWNKGKRMKETTWTKARRKKFSETMKRKWKTQGPKAFNLNKP